jgi:hypothetical protein
MACECESTHWVFLGSIFTICSGSSAISADAEALLLHNIQEGLYMYRIGQTRPSRVFTIDDAANNKYALPVLFLHHNTAVVSGAEDGKVRIRQTTGEEFQTLYHDSTFKCHRTPCQNSYFNR